MDLSTLPIYAGQLYVAKGDLQQASGYFKIVLDEDPNNIPALLGQVCHSVYFLTLGSISIICKIAEGCIFLMPF